MSERDIFSLFYSRNINLFCSDTFEKIVKSLEIMAKVTVRSSGGGAQTFGARSTIHRSKGCNILMHFEIIGFAFRDSYCSWSVNL